MGNYDKTLVTAGPWEAFNANEGMGKEYGPLWSVANDAFHNPKCDGSTCLHVIIENGCEADALLFAEAGTVLSETGMTPRELADEVKRLRAALQKIGDQRFSGKTVEKSFWRTIDISRAALAPKDTAAMPLVNVPIDKWCECLKRFVAACNCPAQVTPNDTADHE